MATQEQLDTIREKIKDIRTAMFTTMDGDDHKSRPLATQELQPDGSLLFMVSKSSDKVKEIGMNPHVGVTYATTDGIRFVSVTGTAEAVDDRAKIKELWNDFLKLWFEGPEDPDITLIKVTMSRVEYWDHDGGKVGAYIDMATSYISGQKDHEGQNKGDQNEVVHLN